MGRVTDVVIVVVAGVQHVLVNVNLKILALESIFEILGVEFVVENFGSWPCGGVESLVEILRIESLVEIFGVESPVKIL